MKNGISKRTRLEAVRSGDIVTLQLSRFRVLSAQNDAGLVTLELDDAPEQPLTLIGVPSMSVNVEPGHDGVAGPGDPESQ